MAIPFSSAAHYIVGEVYDALDSTSANGKTVVIWNPSTGQNDNVTDIIGQSGNSGIDNVYFADCEMLSTPCAIGDNITAMVFDQGDGYSTSSVNLTVTDAGYDVMPNMTLTLQIEFMNLSLDDSYVDNLYEIDLVPASTVLVSCTGIVYGPNMDSEIQTISSKMFSNESSYYSDSDQNSKHYSNSSCSMNVSYGNSEQVYFNCTNYLQYYAVPNNWSCAINATKGASTTRTAYTSAKVNSLLAIELPDTINYGVGGPTLVSNEKSVLISNAGNTALNLSISAYGTSPGDNISMSCPDGIVKNISLDHQRYNVTSSTPGSLSLSQFQNTYTNLSSVPVINNFNLNSRQSDVVNDATKYTYWRVYLVEGIDGDCTGNIVFGAINSPGI
ncbi:MAG TPA: hypothetical protein VHA12_03630 [Candidatus Nanoarchaeia archaeon]|nr:hypothetical protein [Candidatus Nanoarchaeia archaeon]